MVVTDLHGDRTRYRRYRDTFLDLKAKGRADVLTLLKYGVKNAIAVEGTNVPDAVADLTEGTTVTAFLDGDRGGDLIRRELAQVADLDYVAVAPDGKSVEDLSRSEVDAALRNKVPAAHFAETDAETTASSTSTVDPAAESDDDVAGAGESEQAPDIQRGAVTEPVAATDESATEPGAGEEPSETATGERTPTRAGSAETTPSLADHVETVLESSRARLLDESLAVLDDVPAEDAFEAIRDATAVPAIVVFDGDVSQRIVDVAAQRGIGTVVGTGRGEFVKQPTSVRVRTADEFSG